MKALLFFYVIFMSTSYALDTGTGVDGACTHLTLVSGTRTYNCTTLNLTVDDSDFNAQGGAAVIIKVQGSVTIDSVLSLNGGNGNPGSGADPINGGQGGPGASSGGTCNFGGGTCGHAAGDNNGSGSGGGGGGRFGSQESGGGSGAGGSYGVTGGVGGAGGNTSGTAGTGGSSGSIYGATSSWTSSFLGGSGGGAGGYGTDFIGTNNLGGSGGGGGGAIRIIAGGDITINGTITVRGGSGGDAQNTGDGGTGDGGRGGGGSGGAIWLQSEGNVIVAGSLLAIGGNGVTAVDANYQGGNSGAGGNGRIRIDDADGVIQNTGTITPAAVINSLASDTSSLRSYEGDLTCGSIAFVDDDSRGGPSGGLGQFLFVLLVAVTFGVKLKSKTPKKS